MTTPKPRIIIVDDDTVVCSSIRRSCDRSDLDWDITVVESGRKALELAADHPIDLLVTDIHMPEYDGLDVINLIRECRPQTKIIAMSGGGQLDGRDTLALAGVVGADATLEKPFKFQTLINLCHSVLDLEVA